MALNTITGMLAISLAAFLASAPLIAHFFGVFTPGAIVLNLALIPLVTVILIAGLVAACVGMLSGWLAECLLWPMSAFLWLAKKMIEHAQQAPGVFLELDPISIPWTLVGMTTILCSMYIAQMKPNAFHIRWLFPLLISSLYWGFTLYA